MHKAVNVTSHQPSMKTWPLFMPHPANCTAVIKDSCCAHICQLRPIRRRLHSIHVLPHDQSADAKPEAMNKNTKTSAGSRRPSMNSSSEQNRQGRRKQTPGAASTARRANTQPKPAKPKNGRQSAETIRSSYTQSSNRISDTDYDIDDDEDDFPYELIEMEGDVIISDPDEIEKLVFGGKDFSSEVETNKGNTSRSTASKQSPGQKREAELAACRVALSGYPEPIIDLSLQALTSGSVPSDPDLLKSAVSNLIDIAQKSQPQGSTGSQDSTTAVAAISNLQSALGVANAELPVLFAAALRVPQIVRLTQQQMKERMNALPKLLNVDASKIQGICCRHPELLVADVEEIRRKLLLLRNTTGLTGESALSLVTPHMFTIT